ncbi:hypothetical protein JCM3774_000720 [Rhodotorula dairenensis]
MSIHCAGSNSHGQLGVGDENDRHRWTRAKVVAAPVRARPSAIACGANHTLWIDQLSGRVLAAGGNQRGQLGARNAADTSATVFSHVDIAKLIDQAGVRELATDRYTVQGVAAAWETSFFVLRPLDPARSDVVLSTGANDWGERGCPGADPRAATRIEFENLLQPEARRGPLRIVRLQAGPRHVVALIHVGELIDTDGPDVAGTSSSSSSPCRRLLVGWGASRQGQLGCADLQPSSPPPRVTPSPQPVVLPAPYQPTDVCSFSLGKDHTAFLVRDRNQGGPDAAGTVAVLLGSDKHGQLSVSRHGEVVEPPSGVPRRPAESLKSQRSNLLRVEDLLDENEHDPASRWRLVGVHCTWSSTFCHLEHLATSSEHRSATATTTGSRIVGFGHNSHGQLGAKPIARPGGAASAPPRSSSLELSHRVTQLSCGSEHVLALLETGEIMGWGWNEHGNLAAQAAAPASERDTARHTEDNTLADVWQPRRIWPPDGRSTEEAGKATRIAAGNATSWILTPDLSPL